MPNLQDDERLAVAISNVIAVMRMQGEYNELLDEAEVLLRSVVRESNQHRLAPEPVIEISPDQIPLLVEQEPGTF